MSSAETSAMSCPVLDELIDEGDALGVAAHTPWVCTHCMKKRLLEQFGGAEVLYPNEPPPWYKPPEKPKEDETAPVEQQKDTKKSTKNANKAKQNKKLVIPKEELDEYLYKRSFELSDGQLKYEIVKHKRVSKDAAHKLMIQLRQRARNERQGPSMNEDQQGKADMVNARDQLPWCPSKKELFPRGMLSALSQDEQQRFLAICQNIMNAGEIRFANNLKEIKHFQKQAEDERNQMQILVMDSIENTMENSEFVSPTHPLGFTHAMASAFVLERWKKRWHDASFGGRFDPSVPHCSVEWNVRNVRSDPEIRPVLVTNLLKGRVDRIQLPNLRNRCVFDKSKLDSLYPVEECDIHHIFDDLETITSLCLENDVRIAMDATTACHLMGDPFVGHDYSYSIPIRVVQKLVHGAMTNIAVVGKPRILEAVDPMTVQRCFIKYLIKSSFVQKKAGAAPKPAPRVVADSKEASSSQEKKSDFCDPLDSILPSLDRPLNHSEGSSTANHSENGKAYSVFSIIGTNILVRSRPAPLCSEGHQSMKGKTLSFQPKVEYVPNAGAMCLSDTESAWNYCKGFFKQSVNHGLFRTHYMGGHLLQLQHWDAQNVTALVGSEQLWTGPSPRHEARQMISAYTTRFAKVLEEIGHLPLGDFMLVNKNDGFIKILPQADTATKSTDVLDCGSCDVAVADVSFSIREAFIGLESMIPLQWQIVQKRAPGCYVAKDSKLKGIAMSQLPGRSISHDGSQNKQIASKRSRKQRQRDNKRRREAEKTAAGGNVSMPTVEMDAEPAYCLFGASNVEPNSPASSEPSYSPCPSPDQLLIDEPEEGETN
ncbi:hypothetical protein Aduo_013287 [Ancylostoma duodenale]